MGVPVAISLLQERLVSNHELLFLWRYIHQGLETGFSFDDSVQRLVDLDRNGLRQAGSVLSDSFLQARVSEYLRGEPCHQLLAE